MFKRIALLLAIFVLAGCGSAGAGHGSGNRPGSRSSGSSGSSGSSANGLPHVHPQVVEPAVGSQAAVTVSQQPSDPVGDPTAHAPSLNAVKSELKQEMVVAPVNSAGYINPLRYVSVWERTDQGVDAQMPVGAPILAPSPVKVLAIIPDWYAGQPLVYFELLNGPQAGKVQYVAEEITDIAPVGYLPQGGVIARFARSGTGIEYGWATMTGQTLARETSGYFEGEITPAGRWIRSWLNSLGANAGPS
jgi:hypothetical protein